MTELNPSSRALMASAGPVMWSRCKTTGTSAAAPTATMAAAMASGCRWKRMAFSDS